MLRHLNENDDSQKVTCHQCKTLKGKYSTLKTEVKKAKERFDELRNKNHQLEDDIQYAKKGKQSYKKKNVKNEEEIALIKIYSRKLED